MFDSMSGERQKDMRNSVQAESARDQAPQMICEKLNTHVENLQVNLFKRSSSKRVFQVDI